MVDFQIEGRIHGGTPIIKALPRRAIDQVDAGTHAGRIRGRDASLDVLRRVSAVKRLQDVRNRGLHAEGNTIEAAVGKLAHVIGVHRIGVRLGGDLGVVRDSPCLAYGIQHGHQIRGLENRRRATAEENSVGRRFDDAVTFLPITHDRHLANHHVGIVAPGRARTHVNGGIRVEIAISATSHAERHMNVDFEHQPSVFWAARILSFVSRSLPASPVDRAAMNASCGTSTCPSIFMRFLPAFCFSNSLRLREMSPP